MEREKGKADKKYRDLKDRILNLGSALIAYSGGVDSALVLMVAREMLGDRVLAVTARSPVYPSEEIDQARTLARELGVRHKIIETHELTNPRFIDNPKERCYWCKRELFAELTNIARENNLNYVLDGTNFDDLDDFRPGMMAANECGVRSPLKEARLTKEDIRSLGKLLGLPIWDKPSFACLASRFPYGTKITHENLVKVEKAERFIRGFGITQVRVRHHDRIARIEVMEQDMPTLLAEHIRRRISSYLRNLGYCYVAIDLEGYRMGSMNEALPGDDKR
jgi:uncharacterized protein